MMSLKASNPPNLCFPVSLKLGRHLSRTDSQPLPNSIYLLLFIYVYLFYETWNNPAVHTTITHNRSILGKVSLNIEKKIHFTKVLYWHIHLYRCHSDKLWYREHNCVGDTIIYHSGSNIIVNSKR